MKDFVNYNQALELKELGFDEPCFVKVWWLNSTNRYTKESYKPEITMNGQDIKFDYPIPEKHPLSEFDVLELQVPTFSRAFRFFREKYNLHVNKTGNVNYTSFNITEPKIELLSFLRYMDTNNHYEEAESACLDKLIEIAKTK